MLDNKLYSAFVLVGISNCVFAQQNTTENPSELEEVVVIARQQGDFTQITEQGQKLVDLPGALGDPLAAVLSLPGVVADDDSGEPAVRGSSPNDNLYVVDYLPTGYVFHDFGQSVFSEFILQDFNLYSAGFGPRYSNATGAAFDIRLRNPVQQDFSTVVDLSFLRSGIFTEGATSENSAIYASARKSFIHLVVPEGEEEDGIRFIEVPQDEDYQLKWTWDMAPQHRLSLSTNGANDLAEAELSRENEYVRANPDLEGHAKLKSRYDAVNAVYEYQNNLGFSAVVAANRFSNSEYVKWGDGFFMDASDRASTYLAQLAVQLGANHNLQLFAQQRKHSDFVDFDIIHIPCTEFDVDCNANRRERIADKLTLNYKDQTLAINDTWQALEVLELNLGLQWHSNDLSNEQFVNPRIGLKYNLTDHYRLRSQYGLYNQLPEFETIAPELGNPELKSSTASHQTLGLEYKGDGSWSWALDLYYKRLDNLPLALNSQDPDGEQVYVNDVSGEAYGVDLLINKDLSDKWYGWLALSYGKSTRRNERTGQSKNYYLDKPLVLSWVMQYQPSTNLDIGWRWHVRSGEAFTPITGVQDNPFFEDSLAPVYGDPYSDRLPTYSRLDLRIKYHFTMMGLESALIADVINLLNQQNVNDRSLDYDNIEAAGDEVKTVDSVDPGIIPAIGLRIQF